MDTYLFVTTMGKSMGLMVMIRDSEKNRVGSENMGHSQ